MRIFNVDFHIAMYEDRWSIFNQLGHEVDGACLSGHCWVTGRKPGNLDPLNDYNWGRFIPERMREFRDKWAERMKAYDVIVIGYQPCLALWFESFGVPIITIACMRYEWPFNRGSPQLATLEACLRGCTRVANSLSDAKYASDRMGAEWRHISSLCDYAKPSYIGSRADWWDERCKERHSWAQLAEHRGVMSVPANYSRMNLFERYWQNIPLMVPTPCLLLEMRARGEALGYCGWCSGPKGDWSAGDTAEVQRYLPYADYYQWPHVLRYDTAEEKAYLQANADVKEISAAMADHNLVRKQRVLSQWSEVLAGVKR